MLELSARKQRGAIDPSSAAIDPSTRIAQTCPFSPIFNGILAIDLKYKQNKIKQNKINNNAKELTYAS